MTPRGHAEAFARVLDGAPGPRDGDPELTELAGLAARLREVPVHALRPAPAFRAGLRDRLVAEAEGLRAVREHLPAQRRPAEPAPARRTPRRLLAGVLAAALLGGTGAAVASTTALPGELLYPVKRGVEQVRLGLSAGDAARGATELSLARTRLDEAEMLLLRDEQDGPAAARATDALRDFSDAAVSGSGLLLEAYAADGDRRHLEQVAEFGRDVRPRLERMRLSAGPEVDAVISQVVARLAGVDLELRDAAAACGPACAQLLASLGPGPRSGGATTPGTSTPPAVSPSAVPDAAGPAPAPVVTGLVPPGGVAPQAPAPQDPLPAPDGAQVEVGGDGLSADVSGQVGAELGPGGAGVQLPGAGVSAPAPGVGGGAVSVPLPTATVGDTVVDPGDTVVDPGGLGDDETCTVVVLGQCILP